MAAPHRIRELPAKHVEDAAARPALPSVSAELQTVARLAAFSLQREYVAWRSSRGLEPEVEQVAAVDRVIGDLYEDGDYTFPLLHRE